MKQIFQDLKNGNLLVEDIPIPRSSDDELIIKTTCSLISPGTERYLISFGQDNFLDKAKKNPDKVKQVIDKVSSDGLLPTLKSVNNKLSEPLPLGYCNVGLVTEVGKNIKDIKVGDRVVSNGPHAEFVNVPGNLCERIPDSVSDEEAVFTIIGAISLQGIRLAKPTFGESFLVLGLGLVGIMTAKLLAANGCEVFGIDLDESKCSFARSIGINSFKADSDSNAISWSLNQTQEKGFDATIITASSTSSSPMDVAAKATRSQGRVIQVGVTGLDLNREEFYKKELTLQVSCSYGPGRYDKEYEISGKDYPYSYVRWTLRRNFNAILKAFKNKSIKTEKLISHRFKISDAKKAYELIKNNSNVLGILFVYEGFKEKKDSTISINYNKKIKLNPISNKENISLGFFGAGNYSRSVLIPNFKKTEVNLLTLCAKTGVKQAKIARKFGFKNITTDKNSIIKNEEINSVVIATRHDSHADYIIDALLAGKNIFVEKPLCLSFNQLNRISKIYFDLHNNSDDRSANPILMVGFNRRFSPLIIKVKNYISQLSLPKSIVYNINAGQLPNDHWLKDKEIGGGRLIGEACHFLDLLRYLVGYKIRDIKISRLGVLNEIEDTFSLLIDFEDGSIGNINYFANGDKSFPKEKIEIFCQEKVILIDNFRKIKSWGIKQPFNQTLLVQDKGQKHCIRKFVKAIKEKNESPIPIDEILEVHKWLLNLP